MHDNRGVLEGVTKSKHLPDYTYRNNKQFNTIEEVATPGDYYIDRGIIIGYLILEFLVKTLDLGEI